MAFVDLENLSVMMTPLVISEPQSPEETMWLCVGHMWVLTASPLPITHPSAPFPLPHQSSGCALLLIFLFHR